MDHRPICSQRALAAIGCGLLLLVTAVATLVSAQQSENAATAAPRSSADSEPKATYGSGKHVKRDPVEMNGPIFVDWPKPQVALVFSGEQEGYLEPCGCAGLHNQKGGLKRRMTLFDELRKQGWPLVAMDTGGMAKRPGPQSQIKLQRAIESLITIGYSAIGLGTPELGMDLLSVAINLDPENNPLTSANVGLVDFNSGFTSRFKVVEAGGKKFGITSVLGKTEVAQVKNVSDVVTLDPDQALTEVVPTLRDAKCDQLVLMVYGDVEEAQRLAKKFPVFDWVVAAKGAHEPPFQPAPIEGTKSQLIEVGHKGMYVVVVGLYDDKARPFRYQKVPLDARFPDAPAMQQMMVDYQEELRTLGLSGLGLKQLPHTTGREFAGTAACVDCHTKAAEVHTNTPHFHATETLETRTSPPRMHDPECLSCHVTGWEPQKYFPFTSGFLGLKETPHMTGNGCENCHGPAAKHVAVELGELEVSEEEQEKLRAELRLKVVENEGNKEGQVFKEGKVVNMCMQCHDLDNSPDFDFQVYWPQVEHHGKD
jgi:hypothetical protein